MSTPTVASSTPSGKSSSKSAKQSRIVTIHLKAELLSKFSPSTLPEVKEPSQPAASHADTPTIIAPESDSADKSSESNATPLPSDAPTVADDKSLAPASADGVKKKGGPKAGTKRTSVQSNDLKPRGKPGPKKKPRLADGTIDRTTDTPKKGPTAGPAVISSHKLGPKANTGAINAGLRALDRTGKPCRKWERKGFQVKSFTGVGWSVGSWSAPHRDSSTFSGDVKSDTSSDIKANMESSAVPSERSNSGDVPGPQSNGIESSPAPQVSVTA